MPLRWRADRARRKTKGFAKHFVQNRDLSQRKWEKGHLSWTYHHCLFSCVLTTHLVSSVSGQSVTLRQGPWPGFLTLGTIATGDWAILCGRDLPMRCRLCSSISGFYLLHASSIHAPSWDNQKCLLPLPDVPLGTKSPLVENH